MSGPTRMRALLNIYQQDGGAEADEETVQKNPLGIYIKDFNWSKEAVVRNP